MPQKHGCATNMVLGESKTRQYLGNIKPLTRKENHMNEVITRDETQLSESSRSHTRGRLTPENATLLLIDHQSGLVSGVRDLEPDEVRHNVVAFARVARVFRLPVVLTSTAPMMWGPTLPELTEALPGVENIERSLVNAWEEPRVRNAVERTARRNLLIAGITTPVCLTSAATSAAASGYDVYALLDASGTWSDLLRVTAIDQMRQAGVTVTSGVAAFTEMLRDNASPLASDYYAALDLPATRYILQITQPGKASSQHREAA
jgi:nicotinamidase-related amidase